MYEHDVKCDHINRCIQIYRVDEEDFIYVELKEMFLFLFNNNEDLLIRCRIVNCSISSEKKFIASWLINIFLNSRSSYLDAIKTMWIYNIETIKTIVLFFEMNLCLNVLSTNMLIIVVNVSMSFIDSTKMKNVLNSLLISMTNSSIEIFFCEASSMINSLKYWAMNSFMSSLSS